MIVRVDLCPWLYATLQRPGIGSLRSALGVACIWRRGFDRCETSASARSLGNVIDELYPRASGHLGAARSAKSELADAWGNLLDAGLSQVSVVTAPDGSGRISVYAAWTPGSRDELTEMFRTCVEELWACLDSLVIESVEMFSILKRPRNPHKARFFPVADSAESLGALLEGNWIGPRVAGVRI